MGMITSVRAPIPVAEVPRPAEPLAAFRRTGQRPAEPAPVAVTQQIAAPQQMTGTSGTARAEMIPAGLRTEARAVEAAAAARKAYIQASLAAGISPLPLG